MSTAYEALLQHCRENELQFMEIPDEQRVIIPLRTKTCLTVVSAQIDCGMLRVVARAPITIPAGCCPAVAEAICRANFGMQVGNFELDFNDGELTFRAYAFADDDQLPDEAIFRCLAATHAMMERYMPAILSVVYANNTPDFAIQNVECEAI